MNNSVRRCNHGFVLIELLTVFAIIAILTSVAVSYYYKSIQQARVASCESNRHNIEVETISSELTVSAGQYFHADIEIPFFQSLAAMLPPWTGQAWAAKPKKTKKDKRKKDKSDDVADGGLPLINPYWQCPSGGVYVWLITDTENINFPKVGCSVHFAELPEI